MPGGDSARDMLSTNTRQEGTDNAQRIGLLLLGGVEGGGRGGYARKEAGEGERGTERINAGAEEDDDEDGRRNIRSDVKVSSSDGWLTLGSNAPPLTDHASLILVKAQTRRGGFEAMQVDSSIDVGGEPFADHSESLGEGVGEERTSDTSAASKARIDRMD